MNEHHLENGAATPAVAEDEAKPRLKPGPKPGSRRRLPLDEFDVERLRGSSVNAPEHDTASCHFCGGETTEIGLPVIREMIRCGRDRLLGMPDDLRPRVAEVDLLYLAARLDGFCSLTCRNKMEEQ